MSLAEIQSIGLPPERHADRVIAEMLQQISVVTAVVLPRIRTIISTSSDGSPKAQRKLEARLQRSGALGTMLECGKRGTYRLDYYAWSGWDPERDMVIQPNDDLPPKPWLACCVHTICSEGRGRDKVELGLSPLLFVTHHSLSRLAQRHGARTWGDLLGSSMGIWMAMMKFADEIGHEKYLEPPPAGWRVTTKSGVVVVLRRHEHFTALVAATVL